MISIKDWLLAEGEATGDLQNFLWGCRPYHWRKCNSLKDEHVGFFQTISWTELHEALDEIEREKGFASSRPV